MGAAKGNPLMNKTLHDEEFWHLYYALELEDLSRDAVALQLEGLAEDFTVRSEEISSELAGTQTPASRVAEFLFPLTGDAALVLEYEPEIYGASINLFLQPEPGLRQEMGWWDLARWHPYCLRSEELELLLRFWQTAGTTWEDPNAPFLLLAPFVGIRDEIEHARLLTSVGDAYKSLCRSPSGDLPDPSLHFRADYRWEEHSDLGWVFTSDVYSCYSIRNESHAGGDEGSFPFSAWAQQIWELQRAIH